jgi:hypothetical protein
MSGTPRKDAIDRFLDDQGRVYAWPKRGRDRSLVLDYLAARFTRDEQYSEDEVNARLGNWHTWNDPAFLRRMLYDEGLFDRTSDGSRYWRC